MKPVLCVNLYGMVYVYDPNNHTKTWLRSPAALSAYQSLRAISGESTEIIRNDVTDQLLTDARDVDEFNDVAPGGGGGGGDGATPDQVREIVTADGNITRAEVNRPRTLT